MNKDIASILSCISFVKQQTGNNAFLSVDDQNEVVLWESSKGDAGIVCKWKISDATRSALIASHLVDELA